MFDFFYGWYLKCQSDTQTLAVIPAVHRADRKRTCSIQIITDDNAWSIPFDAKLFHQNGGKLSIGENRFSKKGFTLAIYTPELAVEGKVCFGSLSPLKYDIMGPFALVPFMECRHRIWSMQHSVRGTVYINGRQFSFPHAVGYWEGDMGRSFPKQYIWTQCCFPGGSLMLSVADIPLANIHFAGVIGILRWQGREYRVATYLGARVTQFQDNRVRIVQGNMQWEAQLLEAAGHPLQAPANGKMIRTIHESVTCRACYRFRKKGNTFLAFETDKASFEYEMKF